MDILIQYNPELNQGHAPSSEVRRTKDFLCHVEDTVWSSSTL